VDPDQELCMCFHVTARKVVNYIRVEKPKRVGQLSDCFGAGTGCGWCRPLLRNLFEQAVDQTIDCRQLPSSAVCARRRDAYLKAGHGTPPSRNS
jgi:NAD(P)H-nitrite reductase large subunit